MTGQVIRIKDDIEVSIVLVPMPRKRRDGKYPGYLDGKQQPQIFYTFKKSGKIIAPKMPQGLVLSGNQSCIISQGVVLDADDLHEIDHQGWEILREYGMFPTHWVDPLDSVNPQ